MSKISKKKSNNLLLVYCRSRYLLILPLLIYCCPRYIFFAQYGDQKGGVPETEVVQRRQFISTLIPSHWCEMTLQANPVGQRQLVSTRWSTSSGSHRPVSALTTVPEGHSIGSQWPVARLQTASGGQKFPAGSPDGASGTRGSSHWRSWTFQTLPFGHRWSPSPAADVDEVDGDEVVDTPSETDRHAGTSYDQHDIAYQIWSLYLLTTKIWKATKNVETGVVWGLEVTQGHQQHNHSIERISK